MINSNLSVSEFLLCATPAAWIDAALSQQATLLIDHAHCEKKAASTALSLMFRYVDRPDLLEKMSQLAREELLHFEKVLSIMQDRGVTYQHLQPARYAGRLRQAMRLEEPGRLIDSLIIGAIIEARSCERFLALVPFLDAELARFYQSLLRSEERHFMDYLALAQQYSEEDITTRVQQLLALEADLILTPDEQFRFHSGMPS